MHKIKTPKLGASDNSATIVNICFKNGTSVESEDILFEVETSKALHEIEATRGGYFYSKMKIGDETSVGDIIAYISDEPLTNESTLFLKKEVKNKRISKKAAKLIDDYDIDIDIFDKDFIREQDVLAVIKAPIQELNYQASDVIIIGSGGHATMCLDIARAMDLNIIGFLDDNHNSSLSNLSNLGTLNSLNLISENRVRPKLILGIGLLSNLKKRQTLYNNYSKDFDFLNLIHPKSIIESSVKISQSSGIQVMAGAIIGSEVIIEPNVIINSGSIVSHHSKLGHSSHITPGACIAGGVTIGERCTVGMNSSIFLGVNVSNDTLIPNLTRIDIDI